MFDFSENVKKGLSMRNEKVDMFVKKALEEKFKTKMGEAVEAFVAVGKPPKPFPFKSKKFTSSSLKESLIRQMDAAMFNVEEKEGIVMVSFKPDYLNTLV